MDDDVRRHFRRRTTMTSRPTKNCFGRKKFPTRFVFLCQLSFEIKTRAFLGSRSESTFFRKSFIPGSLVVVVVNLELFFFLALVEVLLLLGVVADVPLRRLFLGGRLLRLDLGIWIRISGAGDRAVRDFLAPRPPFFALLGLENKPTEVLNAGPGSVVSTVASWSWGRGFESCWALGFFFFYLFPLTFHHNKSQSVLNQVPQGGAPSWNHVKVIKNKPSLVPMANRPNKLR